MEGLTYWVIVICSATVILVALAVGLAIAKLDSRNEVIELERLDWEEPFVPQPPKAVETG